MRGILQRLTQAQEEEEEAHGVRTEWQMRKRKIHEQKIVEIFFVLQWIRNFVLISHPHSDSEDFFPIFHIINFKFILSLLLCLPNEGTHIFFGVSLMNFNKISPVDKTLTFI